jgi:hypothetical protein
MADPVEMAGVRKAEATLLVLFIPSVDRNSQPIDQEHWEKAAMEMLGLSFGGATAFPRARGVWRDDEQGGKLIFDNPVVIQCYTSTEAIKANINALKELLLRMGTETHQGAVGFVIGGTYMELSFPLPPGEGKQ